MKKFLMGFRVFGWLIKALFTVLKDGHSLRPKKNVHGEKLLELPDDQLFEAVYFYNLDLVESYPDEVNALLQISPERRVVYI